MQSAISFPNQAWPAYDLIPPMREPESRLGRHISRGANLRRLPPNHALTRPANVDLFLLFRGLRTPKLFLAVNLE